jgi:hypothetical protein
MPEEARTDDYEKVAFLGQVPVEIIGTVASGDYIIPSGDHDGFGIAVHPEDIRPEQIPQIVGVAWEDGTDEFLNLVNVVVGLDHSATAARFNALRAEMDMLKAELEGVEALVAGLGAPQEPAVAEVISPLPKGAGTFRRWLRGGGGRPEAHLAEAAPAASDNTSTAAPAEPSMLQGMSKEDILAAVEDARNGKTPAAWQNVNSKELSVILQTVVETAIEDAESKAITQAETTRQQAFANYPQQLSSVLNAHASMDDLIRASEQRAVEMGLNPQAMREVEQKFVARVLDSQFSTANIQAILRENPDVLHAVGSFKPGTVAEARFVAQIQTELQRVIAEQAPEIATHMSANANTSTPLPAGLPGRKSSGK